jgi:hypothetical protein
LCAYSFGIGLFVRDKEIKMKRLFILLILVNAMIVLRLLYLGTDSTYAGTLDYHILEGSSAGYSLPDSVRKSAEERQAVYREVIEATDLEAVHSQVITQSLSDASIVASGAAIGSSSIEGISVAGESGAATAGGDDAVAGITSEPPDLEDVVTGLPTAPPPSKPRNVSAR